MEYKDYQVIYETSMGKKKIVDVRGRDKSEARKNFLKKYPIQKIILIKELFGN